MNVNDCLNEGLLVKIKPNIEMAKSSIEMATHKLEISEVEFENKLFESAIISAYSSMFHSARALLFKDGFKERSHFAVFVFANENYSDKIEKKYLNELNYLRLQRHKVMYGLENSEIQEVEAESSIALAKGFLESVKKIIK